ncbi:ABC-type multidrug transport system fused ATPase/permease subunit [Aquimarina sp. EL_43]|uniref:DUF2975 domain-containing protein n=1 Tax=Aquimarina TaxID=290174 RepID=UPI00046FC468|nr:MULTISPECIES: DUF2975 domain-containing protein [Aquimarina]MBG6132016.1 ABC-type multidrug transport system fused ATPase/permease subunit [Aquimarina sp. EL_35]MBG6149580.1 ABC-type multidrug transport system fused ATPase/permease subunit [Aquimarina sp. EL_32]MBG6170157.1 ABC-type multidrug transport system fused ATPase/permease subunit [Aquimarina sp. EL_43]
METKQVLNAMKIISWVIFIGLCIKLGAILISSTISLFVNEEAAENLYLGLDLSNLYSFSIQYYIMLLSLIISILAFKVYMFYLVIKIFSKIDFDKPFTPAVAHLISSISYVSLWIGLLAYFATRYSKRLLKKGVVFEYDFGSSEFLFMAGIIFIIALIFKRGIEIQSENELTI